jgi:hypothetical protein
VEDLDAGLQRARTQWLDLLTSELSLPESFALDGEQIGKAQLFSILVRNIGVWFNELNDARRQHTDDRAFPVTFTLDDCDRLLQCSAPPDDLGYRHQILHARFALDAYIKAVIGAALIPGLVLTPLHGMGVHTVLEDVTHAALVRLHDFQSQAPDPTLAALCGRLLHSVLHALADVYSESATGWDKSWRPGPFSDLRLQELSLLASRDEAMLRRYGTKLVEKRFEQQLALLFQSLGFIVIQTRTGARTVDLVCVSNDPLQRVTFLVEAKTSKAPYSLPAKDERALRDYVAEIDETLTTLPRLRFVLLVSHGATKTLEGKLRDFETKSATSIRFVTASALGQLRSHIPGPAPVGPFAKLVLESPHILPDDFVAALSETYRRHHDAHRDFAQALMSAGRGLPPM